MHLVLGILFKVSSYMNRVLCIFLLTFVLCILLSATYSMYLVHYIFLFTAHSIHPIFIYHVYLDLRLLFYTILHFIVYISFNALLLLKLINTDRPMDRPTDRRILSPIELLSQLKTYIPAIKMPLSSGQHTHCATAFSRKLENNINKYNSQLSK